MANSLFKPIVSLILIVLFMGQSSSWTYNGTKGPDEWPILFPKSCAGKKQSPINIKTAATVKTKLEPFVFINYKNVTLGSLLENGHTVVLSMPLNYPINETPTITGGGLNSPYIFKQLHFHWGSDDSYGSEHLLDSAPTSGELHLVHYNSKYGSYENALNHSDGLAVLAILIQPSSIYNNVAFDSITSHLAYVIHEGDQVVIQEPINFHDFLPYVTSSFYRYAGSLTTPNCNEIVIWSVFSEPTWLSNYQLRKFRELTNDEGEPLVNNNRPVQPINKRTVYRTM